MKKQQNTSFRTLSSGALLAGVVAFTSFAAAAQPLTVEETNPNKGGDGTAGAAAQRAQEFGPLPASNADVALKAAADRARAQAEGRAAQSPFGPTDRAAAGEMVAGPAAPVVVGGINVPGLGGVNSTPPDTTGAIGPTRFIQLVNRAAGIYNRVTGALITSATLNQLAGQAATVNSFDPQIIWDPTTNRFYYVMDSVFSSTDNKLSFGFSKTASPTNLTTDWCHYQLSFGSRFPDYPKLGDSRYFVIFGVNSFGASFIGSDLIAVSKPGAGTTCPAATTFKVGVRQNLPSAFTPVPSNEIDSSAIGFVVARNLSLPSTRLWLFKVTLNPATLLPVFSAGIPINVANYTVPANATQPTFTQVLDTLDARPTQAVQAIDPRLGTFSLWVQHTIANGTVSGVRWYEINPVPAVPVVQRTGTIVAANSFLFNAAISPDRRVDGAISAFGNNAIVNYSVSSRINNINPRIVAGSTVNGGVFTFLGVIFGVSPYRDFSCPNPGNVCRWGDYSAATPDPRPAVAGIGQVWGTNQYSGLVNPPTNTANFRTRIFNLRP